MEICISSVASLSSLLRSVLFARKRREGIGRPPFIEEEEEPQRTIVVLRAFFSLLLLLHNYCTLGIFTTFIFIAPPRRRCLEIVDQSLEIRVERISKSVLSASQQVGGGNIIIVSNPQCISLRAAIKGETPAPN